MLHCSAHGIVSVLAGHGESWGSSGKYGKKGFEVASYMKLLENDAKGDGLSGGLSRGARAFAMALSLVALLSAGAVCAEVNDFWDTTGRTVVDVKNSAVSAGAGGESYFETGHDRSVEKSKGENVNTFPAAGFYLMVK